MASTEVNPNVTEQTTPSAANEPELHLLLSPDTFEPLWKSLSRGLDDFFFPKKLPPLKLESKPIPVKDIWGFYNYKKNGAVGSTVAHLIVLGLIIGGTFITFHHAIPAVANTQVTSLILDDYVMKAAKTQAGGGGGGGDRDVLKASAGKLPKFSLKPQIVPPAAVIRNPNPKLTAEPTVMVDPDIKIATNNLPNLGDPKSTLVIPSNGTGSLGGIGSGDEDGVGTGKGPGVGPGEGGNAGGGHFRAGKGITQPRIIYGPDPEFSEEARKAKYQGLCVLEVTVDVNGLPTNIRVVNSLGMGLDEKAIEAVKNWRFEPAMKDGHPLAVTVNLEVDFHLY
jgi:protein TonB